VPPEILAAGISSPLALRVIAVLEHAVNPSIASHGGRADLIGLNEEDGTAYLRLSGGCQGCAMSQMTLKQGIETTLLEEVPELTKVVDVTDHGEGENPFYA
jgi:Fe/S biogenesis protein NfuA